MQLPNAWLLEMQADVFDLQARSTGLMRSIPEPSGLHLVFASDDEESGHCIADDRRQDSKAAAEASQGPRPGAILSGEGSGGQDDVLEVIAGDVAKHTVETDPQLCNNLIKANLCPGKALLYVHLTSITWFQTHQLTCCQT